MRGDGALREQDGLRRIDPAGDQGGRHLADARVQLGRVDVDRQRMEVGEEEQALGLILHAHPTQDCPEEIAEMEVARWLNPETTRLVV